MRFRVCHKCHHKLPMTHKYFSIDKSRKYGLKYKCRKCGKAYNKTFNVIYKDRRRTLTKKYKINKIKNGLCVACITPRLQNSSKFCEKHWYHKMSRKHFNTSIFWVKLKELAEKQKYTCPYTNTTLIPGLNMSLDHKFPISRNKSRKFDINNLQWVDYNANLAKNNLTHQEFLMLCRQVCINFNVFDMTLKKVG